MNILRLMKRYFRNSLLVREINWLETTFVVWNQDLGLNSCSPYSLGKLIDWKPTSEWELDIVTETSLLVREINWLETKNIYFALSL